MFDLSLLLLLVGIASLIGNYVYTRRQDNKNEEDQKELLQSNEEIRNQLLKQSEALNAKSDELAQQSKEYAISQRSSFDKIQDLQEKLIIEAKEQSSKNAEIAQLNRELRISAEKTANLTNKMNDYITGNGSFCYADIFMFIESKFAKISINHFGNSPLHNIEFSVVNIDHACKLTEFVLNGNVVPKEIESKIYKFEIGSLIKNERKLEEEIPVVPKQENSYHFRFRSNDREWFQRILLRPNFKGYFYVWATQIYYFDGGKETLLAEGTPHTIGVNDFESNKFFISRSNVGPTEKETVKIPINNKWTGFPLKQNEFTPWSQQKCHVHFDGRGIRTTSTFE